MLHFDGAGDGLRQTLHTELAATAREVPPGGPLGCFELRGSDGVWRPAGAAYIVPPSSVRCCTRLNVVSGDHCRSENIVGQNDHFARVGYGCVSLGVGKQSICCLCLAALLVMHRSRQWEQKLMSPLLQVAACASCRGRRCSGDWSATGLGGCPHRMSPDWEPPSAGGTLRVSATGVICGSVLLSNCDWKFAVYKLRAGSR